MPKQCAQGSTRIQEDGPRGGPPCYPPDAMKKRSAKECPEAESQRFGIRYVGTMVDAECDLFLYSLQSTLQSIETTS